jgi:hypothetical protein
MYSFILKRDFRIKLQFESGLGLDYHNFFSLNINSLDHLVKYKEIKRFFQFT